MLDGGSFVRAVARPAPGIAVVESSVWRRPGIIIFAMVGRAYQDEVFYVGAPTADPIHDVVGMALIRCG